jgi:hypothetical protein
LVQREDERERVYRKVTAQWWVEELNHNCHNCHGEKSQWPGPRQWLWGRRDIDSLENIKKVQVPSSGCLVEANRGPLGGCAVGCRPWLACGWTSPGLSVPPANCSASAAAVLTHFRFLPFGLPRETDRLGELHRGEDRLDRDCVKFLLKQKAAQGDEKLSCSRGGTEGR